LLAVQPEPRVVREIVREVVYVERESEPPREQREQEALPAPMPADDRSPQTLAHEPRPVPPTMYEPHEPRRFGPPPRGVASRQPRNYLELRESVLAYGIEALPERELPAGTIDGGDAIGGPVTYRELRESLLDDERRRERGAGSPNRSFNPFLFLNGGEPL
jgi:hypothetical protein